MFRDMRRSKQLLLLDETVSILNNCTSGVLGVIGDEGYPYTVPVSYVYKDNKIYFHCAKKGHKIESIEKNSKVTFCVIEKDDVIQNKFTTNYKSVCIFGKAKILTEHLEKINALEALTEKYSPNYIKEGKQEIQKGLEAVSIVQIEIEHITGKASR
ncbi:pyridoxamine 5'-phosphate oxidase family protein [Haloimpatiens sp. FM7315]|uniref:pyridoxamine 5'-phosphate oxidase family protein n=1 Tax=Haloimpatiens sp. FM7315 TaxID=3298609 RepID=UPI0035A37AF7